MVRMHLKPSRQKLTASKSLFTFSSIVSLGTLLFYNVPFFSYVAQNTDEPTGGKFFLLASLVVIMLVLNFMMTYLVMWLLRVVGRVLLAVLAVINATALHFILTYGVIIDATTIENVFNTRYSEASGFFSWSLWLCILGLGVLPALYCLWQPVVYGKANAYRSDALDQSARHRTGRPPTALVLSGEHLSRPQQSARRTGRRDQIGRRSDHRP